MIERRHGSFERSIRVPDTLDEDNVEASFDNGVLKVRLLKRPEAIGKQQAGRLAHARCETSHLRSPAPDERYPLTNLGR
jgi:Hsp20/alpha crystallin family